MKKVKNKRKNVNKKTPRANAGRRTAQRIAASRREQRRIDRLARDNMLFGRPGIGRSMGVSPDMMAGATMYEFKLYDPYHA